MEEEEEVWDLDDRRCETLEDGTLDGTLEDRFNLEDGIGEEVDNESDESEGTDVKGFGELRTIEGSAKLIGW